MVNYVGRHLPHLSDILQAVENKCDIDMGSSAGGSFQEG